MGLGVERGSRRKGHMYTYDLHLKLTQHCKATILYFKIYIFKKDAVINLHIPKSRWGDFLHGLFFF